MDSEKLLPVRVLHKFVDRLAKDSHSEKQLDDVKNLMRNQINADYIEKWTTELGLKDLLNETRTDKK